MRYRRPRPCLAGLRARLESLRERAAYVRCHARLGAELRLMLAERGSPTWAPGEDLAYRGWITTSGDEEARLLLEAVDGLLEEPGAEVEARAAGDRGGEAGDATRP